MMRPLLVTITEAATLLAIPRARAYELAARGELPGVVRLGERQLRVHVATLERYLAERAARADAGNGGAP